LPNLTAFTIEKLIETKASDEHQRRKEWR